MHHTHFVEEYCTAPNWFKCPEKHCVSLRWPELPCITICTEVCYEALQVWASMWVSQRWTFSSPLFEKFLALSLVCGQSQDTQHAVSLKKIAACYYTKHLSTNADSSTNITIGWTKNTQKSFNFFFNFFPLLFHKDSKSLKILDIWLWEVGAKRRLNNISKLNRQTDGRTDTQTDRQTDILTYRKHRPRGPMLWNSVKRPLFHFFLIKWFFLVKWNWFVNFDPSKKELPILFEIFLICSWQFEALAVCGWCLILIF